MNKSELRDALVHELWRMTKMDIITHLREFVEGETAALYYLCTCGSETVTPTQISENLQVSRARAANILRSLREKKYVVMDISEDDRRKMDVAVTESGRKAMEQKYQFLLSYFDLYIDVLGEEDIADLTRLLKKTVDCNLLLDPKKAGEMAAEEKRMIDNESGEDYLEAVLRLSAKQKDVHGVEVARELGVSKPAVTKAMRLLTQKGYVQVVDNHIRLTESGRQYAESVFEKHRLLTAFLVRLGVDAENAEADACRMEHLISGATYEAVKNFMK